MASALQRMLPVEMLEEILMWLPIRDILRAESVNKHIRDVIGGSIKLQIKLWRRTTNSHEDLPQPQLPDALLQQYRSYIELNPNFPNLRWDLARPARVRYVYNDLAFGSLVRLLRAHYISFAIDGPPNEIRFRVSLYNPTGSNPTVALNKLEALVPAAIKAMYPLSCSLKGTISVEHQRGTIRYRKWAWQTEGIMTATSPRITASIETSLPTMGQILAVLRMLLRHEPRQPARPTTTEPWPAKPTTPVSVPMESCPQEIGDIPIGALQYTYTFDDRVITQTVWDAPMRQRPTGSQG